MPKIDISVRELVDKVNRGELVLPEMQRRYVWPATRVRDLLDSLYRGYPSGTILAWETDEDVEIREMALAPNNLPITSQRLLLLDGQQRITSLAAILRGEPVHVRGRSRAIEILFNLEHPEGPPTEVVEVDENDDLSDEINPETVTERDIHEELKKRTFVVANRPLQNDPLWVSVSDIFRQNENQILRTIGINSDDPRWDMYSGRLQKVRKIADYSYVMQVLENDMSYEEVTEIFVRVNSLGIKLRGSDLALAQITSKWRGFMRLLEEFANEFGENSDYIASGLSTRMLIVLATQQSKFKTVGKITRQSLENSWEKAKKGLRFAANFLQNNAHIEKLGILSSPFLLIPIAAYAVLKDEQLSSGDEKKLLRWFYLAHMWGHYSMGSSESILDADLSVLFKKGDLDELLMRLEQHIKKVNVGVPDIAGRSQRSPMFSMLYIVLKSQGAKDWKTGLGLSDEYLGRAHQIQFHHIFPKSLLQAAEYSKGEINEIANLAFIGGKTNRQITNKRPIDYLESEIIAKRGEDALTSQLVPLDRKLWEIENYKDFLAARRKAIAGAINDFMGKFD
jgi:hypothetical protein